MSYSRTALWILIFAFLSSDAFAGPGEEPWHLKKDLEGIRVYTRSVKNSPIHELKSEMTLAVPMEKAAALYEKVERMMEWFHRVKEVKYVQKISEDKSLIYFAADLPWPLSDRDGIYWRVKSIEPSTRAVIYTLHSANDTSYPVHKGRVRVTYLDAEWKFVPISENQTQISFRMHTSAGGHIPAAIVNNFTVLLPYKTFQKFRTLLMKEKS